VIALALAGLLPIGAMAQNEQAQPATGAGNEQASDQNAADPPARVGRLSYVEGQVLQFGEGHDDWVPAQLNFPVTGDTAFATGSDGRAEFDLGAATARIDFGTELDVVTLDEANTDVRLPQGAVAMSLPSPTDSVAVNTVVTTSRGNVTLGAPGHYNISAGTEDQPTVITVVDGLARVPDSCGGSFVVGPGQSALLTGNPNQPSFAIQAAQAGAFVAWVRQRDQTVTAAPPPPAQVSRQITGVSELSTYGSWQTEREYGAVWIPRHVESGWRPYSDGHWSYIRPWGWTWIDSKPWGFAPFHYGRWVRIRDRWAWAPGTTTVAADTTPAPPVYAPALVVFASMANAQSSNNSENEADNSGPGGPAVAWYPLGWDEPYVPPYRVSLTYIRQVNVRVVEPARIVQVTNVYNQIYVQGGNYDPYRKLDVGRYRKDAVAVSRTTFESARQIEHAEIRTNVQALHPALRPVDVKAPAPVPRPKLATAEPPRAKILPAAKRAPIPSRLMAPVPAPIRPAAATIRPQAQPAKSPAAAVPVKPAVAPTAIKPETKPETKPGVRPPRPVVARPEARPEPTPHEMPKPVFAKPEAHPGEKARPAQPAVARPETRHEAKPHATTPPKPVFAKPEAHPEEKARPVPAHPAVARPEPRLETKPHAIPPRPAFAKPEARPERHPNPTPSQRPVAIRPPQPHHQVTPPPRPAVGRPEARPERKPTPARPPVTIRPAQPDHHFAPPARPATTRPETRQPRFVAKPAVTRPPTHPEPRKPNPQRPEQKKPKPQQ
jgi:hypothetical protein